MWYRLILAYREVGRGGEKTIHKTKGKYERPIFVMDPKSKDPTLNKGTGSKVFGPGHYTSQNKVVAYGYDYPYTRVEKLPQGTRILDLDRIPNFHARRIIESFDPNIDKDRLKSDLSLAFYSLNDIIKFLVDTSKNPDVKKYLTLYDSDANYRQIYPKLIELGYDAVEYYAGRNFSLDDVLSRIKSRPQMLETEKQRNKRDVNTPFVKSKRFQRRINKLEKQIELSAAEFENLLKMFKNQYGENWMQSWKPVSTKQENIDRLFEKDFINDDERKFLLDTNLQKKNVLVINATTLINPKLFQKERFRPETLSEEEKKELNTLKNATTYDVTKHILLEMKKKDPENWMKKALEDFLIDTEILIKLKNEQVISPIEAGYLGGDTLGVSDFLYMMKENFDLIIENFDLVIDMISSFSLDEKRLLLIYSEAKKYEKSPDFSERLIKTLYFEGKINKNYILSNIMPFIKIGFFKADDILNSRYYDFVKMSIIDENNVSDLHDIGMTVDQMKNMSWDNFHLYNNIEGLLEIGFDKEFLINNITNAKSPMRLKNIGFSYWDIIGNVNFDTSDINLHVFIDEFLQEDKEEVLKDLTFEQKIQILEVKISTVAVNFQFKDFKNRFKNFLILSSKYNSKDISRILFKEKENFTVYDQIVSDKKTYVTKSDSNIDLKEKIIGEFSEEYQAKNEIFNQIKDIFTRIDQKYYNGRLFCECGYIKLYKCPNCESVNSEINFRTSIESSIEILKELLPYYELVNGDASLSIYFELIEIDLFNSLLYYLGNMYSLYRDKLTWKQTFPELPQVFEIYKILQNPSIGFKLKGLLNQYNIKNIFKLFEDPEFMKKFQSNLNQEPPQIDQNAVVEEEKEEPLNIDDDED